MALSPEILAQAIAARYGNPPTSQLQILCEEIIKHIMEFGQVAPLVVVGASATGGPVTGATILSPPGVIK